MSFDALQGFLQRKKRKGAETAIPAGEESEVASRLTEPQSSIYATSAREACENHSRQKRERSPCKEAHLLATTTAAKEVEAPCTPPPQSHPTGEKVRQTHLTEGEFLDRRRNAEEVLLRCAEHIAPVLDIPTLSSNIVDESNEKGDDVLCGHRLSALPLPLCQFLEKRLQRLSSATTMSNVFCEEEENDLICAMKPVLNQNHEARGQLPAQLERLVAILRTFWLVLCWHWRTALHGPTSNASREGGWTYSAYLLSRHALPEVVRNTRGREVALTLEAWQEFHRVRQDVFDFLAYALCDLDAAAELINSSSGGGDVKAGVGLRIIPVEIVDSLFEMVQHLRRRDFGGCRQLYVDLTMGTANWKLGLFSGGEVHMRRSMERIERRRIAHLLHNENAVRLLHALRDLMDFVHKHEVVLESSGIFAKQT